MIEFPTYYGIFSSNYLAIAAKIPAIFKLYPDDITEKGSHLCFYFLRGFKISRHTSAQLARGLKTLGSHLNLN